MLPFHAFAAVSLHGIFEMTELSRHRNILFLASVNLCSEILYGRVAQRIRRPTSNRKIVGSIPIVVIIFLFPGSGALLGVV